jgi:hypothetical protein
MSDRNPLLIPTNPDYDPDHPDDGVDLANPVTVNNQQILFANEVIAVTGEHIAANRDITQCKLELKVLRRMRNDLHRQILRDRPPRSGNDVKNNQLVDAYIFRMAVELQLDGMLHQIDEQEATLEASLAEAEAEAANCALKLTALKLASQNTMTFLSWVKEEAKRSKYGI